MKTLAMKLVPLAFLAAAPLGALAAPPPGPGGRQGMGPPADLEERIEKRMRVARAIGLAEALDLDAPEATRLAETLEKLDQKCRPIHKQQEEAMQVLRQAARGDTSAQAKVDDAVKRVFDARAQLAAVDRETYDAVAKGLSPEKRARAAVFLGRFQQRFGRGMAMVEMMGGPGGMGLEGMVPGMGRGARRWMGMGRGMGGPGQGPGPGSCPDDCPGR